MATLNDRIVLFGGFEFASNASGASAHDTWAFDGEQWSQILPTTYPPERGNHAMAAVGSEIVLVGGSNDRDTWLLGAPVPSHAGSGGTNGGAAGANGGTPVAGPPTDSAGAPGVPGGVGGDTGSVAGAPGLGVECNDTRDCAPGLYCDVNHHCSGAGAPGTGGGKINEPPCAAPASAMITSFGTGSSLVDVPNTGADVGLTSPTISTASGALVITLDTGKPTTTNPYAFIGLPFNACTGAGAYSGVKFKASGALSAGCSIQFSAIDKEHALPANGGTCTAPNCYASSARFDLPATPADVTILFVDQSGGGADPGVGPLDPAHLLKLQWQVIPSTGVMPGCKGTVTIDDVMFL